MRYSSTISTTLYVKFCNYDGTNRNVKKCILPRCEGVVIPTFPYTTITAAITGGNGHSRASRHPAFDTMHRDKTVEITRLCDSTDVLSNGIRDFVLSEKGSI